MRIFLCCFVFITFKVNVYAFNEYKGYVEYGEQLSELINLKTANLYVPHLNEKPGIYACQIDLSDLQMFNKKALCFIERYPNNIIYAHILDFDQNIYHQPIKMRLIHFIRELKEFTIYEEALKAIENDKKIARRLLASDSIGR